MTRCQTCQTAWCRAATFALAALGELESPQIHAVTNHELDFASMVLAAELLVLPVIPDEVTDDDLNFVHAASPAEPATPIFVVAGR